MFHKAVITRVLCVGVGLIEGANHGHSIPDFLNKWEFRDHSYINNQYFHLVSVFHYCNKFFKITNLRICLIKLLPENLNEIKFTQFMWKNKNEPLSNSFVVDCILILLTASVCINTGAIYIFGYDTDGIFSIGSQ